MKLFKTGSKRTEKKEYCWSFYNREGEVFLKTETFCLPLKEKIIIQKSREFFDDPDPCYIHRSAVMNRLYFELEKAAEGLPFQEKLPLGNLPEDIKVYLDLPGTAEYILLV